MRWGTPEQDTLQEGVGVGVGVESGRMYAEGSLEACGPGSTKR